MRKRTMRCLAMFLALIMVFTVLPLTAMAETTAGVRAELVTDASQLKAGDQIVIAAKDYEMALGTNQKSNNREAVAVTKTGTFLRPYSITKAKAPRNPRSVTSTCSTRRCSSSSANTTAI